MVVRRKYSLPECTLILEGISDPNDSDETSTRPVLSVLVNAECHLVGKPHALSGDRGFLEAFAATVSQYAQGMLSGISPPTAIPQSSVSIEPLPSSLHRLTVRDPNKPEGETIQIDLTTLQLFDLVEAIDQMVADRRTLPDWTLDLKPRTRHEAHNEEPLAKRAAPFALGVSSLAVVALLFSFLPVPEVERPREPISSSSEETSTLTPSAEGDPPTSAPPEAEEPLALEPTLDTVPEILDADRLLALRYSLYQQVNQAWTIEPTFDRDLVYRVSMGIDGAILGYRSENETARQYVDETPLPDLVYVPVEGGTAEVESLAEFKVVFTENGILQVSPWDGYPSQPADRPKIDDLETLDRLLTDVQDRLYDRWTIDPVFDRDLEFRLAVTEDGSIVEYEPLSSAASRYFGELPIQSLYDPSAIVLLKDGQVNLTAIAEFRVVFTARQAIEISPWDGVKR
ncbi:MAG: DUF4335 domain-containing protein [Cyanobacteria bacterium SID2]|nr:DUF4335 domain-containing protein [Cyanobacteria bacterium SID2]MBP0006647.1 DUF4335 domain-containing protein [Cyanobacteria bacterium SBC]